MLELLSPSPPPALHTLPEQLRAVIAEDVSALMLGDGDSGLG